MANDGNSSTEGNGKSNRSRRGFIGIVGTGIGAGVMIGPSGGERDIAAPDPEEYSQILDRMPGTGDPDDPYIISKLRQLQAIEGDRTGYFELGSSIDAAPTATWNGGNPNPAGFVPISQFSGALDGNGHEIDELTINRPEVDQIGLIGLLEAGRIVDVGLVDATVRGNDSVGVLVGETALGNIVHDVSASGTVTGTVGVGGLIGTNPDHTPVEAAAAAVEVAGTSSVGGLLGECSTMSNVSGATATGDVVGEHNVGGLVGWLDESEISESYATGHVCGETATGGLVGATENDVEITSAAATGDVQGVTSVGGLVGDSSDTRFDSGLATGTVLGTNAVGGFVGSTSWGDRLTHSVATGSVRGDTAVGGLVGRQWDGTVEASYAVGAVTGAENVGGLVGCLDELSTVTDAYTMGSVSGTSVVGGLIGSVAASSVASTYAVGPVVGEDDVGGLVGHANDTRDVADSYWDVPATGLTDSDGGTGIGELDDDAPARDMVGAAAAETMSTFDFTAVWETIEDPADYPVLRAIDSEEQLEDRA